MKSSLKVTSVPYTFPPDFEDNSSKVTEPMVSWSKKSSGI